jgi:hypothetical protein
MASTTNARTIEQTLRLMVPPPNGEENVRTFRRSHRPRSVSSCAPQSRSPDGTQIAYAGEIIDPEIGATTGGFVGVVNADGSGRHVIFTGPERGRRFDTTWSPDGGEIAFKRESSTGNRDRSGPSPPTAKVSTS